MGTIPFLEKIIIQYKIVRSGDICFEHLVENSIFLQISNVYVVIKTNPFFSKNAFLLVKTRFVMAKLEFTDVG